jgi:signal peptidase I
MGEADSGGFLELADYRARTAYNRQWRRTLGFVVITLLLDLLFLHFRVWATFTSLAVGLLVLLLWRIITSVDAAVQARKRLQRPGQSVPVAATLGAVGIVVAAVLLQSTNWLNPFAAFRAFRIPSGSMCPTLCEVDRIVTDVKAFRSQKPERGDLVMFLFDRKNALHVKRVAAVGGDEVVSIQGRLSVNGSRVESPTSACGTLVVRTSSDSQSPPDINGLRVPPNRFFVVGDDLDNSYDSRFYGAIDVSTVRGKPLYLYWLRKTDRIGCAVK